MMFEYTAKYWHVEEEDKVASFPKLMIERGLVAGENYGAAATRVSEYYGVENLVELTIRETNYTLNEEEIRSLYLKEDE